MTANRKAVANNMSEAIGHATDVIQDATESGTSRINGALNKVQTTATEAKEALVAGAGTTLANVRDIAVEKADEARETLSDVGERLASTLERASTENGGDVLKSKVLSSVAHGLTRASTTLRQRSVADLTEDVRILAKRHPGAFMAAAAVVGFAAARFVRASARRQRLDQQQGPLS
jgi:hypothetical protein